MKTYFKAKKLKVRTINYSLTKYWMIINSLLPTPLFDQTLKRTHRTTGLAKKAKMLIGALRL